MWAQLGAMRGAILEPFSVSKIAWKLTPKRIHLGESQVTIICGVIWVTFRDPFGETDWELFRSHVGGDFEVVLNSEMDLRRSSRRAQAWSPFGSRVLCSFGELFVAMLEHPVGAMLKRGQKRQSAVPASLGAVWELPFRGLQMTLQHGSNMVPIGRSDWESF